jgi:hypothetical protein
MLRDVKSGKRFPFYEAERKTAAFIPRRDKTLTHCFNSRFISQSKTWHTSRFHQNNIRHFCEGRQRTTGLAVNMAEGDYDAADY